LGSKHLSIQTIAQGRVVVVVVRLRVL